VRTPKSGVGLARSQGRGQAADTSSSYRAGKPSRKASDRVRRSPGLANWNCSRGRTSSPSQADPLQAVIQLPPGQVRVTTDKGPRALAELRFGDGPLSVRARRGAPGDPPDRPGSHLESLPPVRQDAVCFVKELDENGIDLAGSQQGGAVAQAG
jgi:hypothetical protein